MSSPTAVPRSRVGDREFAPVVLLIVLPTAVTLGLVAWAMWGGAAESPPDDIGG